MDDLSKILINSNTGCNINGKFINHLMYADDSVLIAPSPQSLQDMLNVCKVYAENNDIIYNAMKTVVMCVNPKSLRNLAVPNFVLHDKVLSQVLKYKYLGVIM